MVVIVLAGDGGASIYLYACLVIVAHEPPALALMQLPEVEALFDSVRDEILAGDPAAATRRFFGNPCVA